MTCLSADYTAERHAFPRYYLRKVFVSDYVPDVVMSSLKTCNVGCRGPLREGKGGELGVRVGSLSTTRDECGRTFAPRASKGDFQVSKEGGWLCGQKGKGCKEGMGKLATDIIHEM
jgi:hypothetical protein